VVIRSLIAAVVALAFAGSVTFPASAGVPAEAGAPATAGPAGKLAATPFTPVLPESSDPRFQASYVDGEYQIARLGASSGVVPVVDVPGSYGNGVIDVNVRLIGDASRQVAGVWCRRTGDIASPRGYRLLVSPGNGLFTLERVDNGQRVALADPQPSGSILTGNQTNQLELSCDGATLTAAINGTVVASVADATYQAGAFALLSGGIAPEDLSEAWFSQLEITPAR
jgi:hypothetical protein